MNKPLKTIALILGLAVPSAFAAESKFSHDLPEGALLAIPTDAAVSIGWAIPPGILKKLNGKPFSFNVLPNGKILLAAGKVLFYPEDVLPLTTKVPIQNPIWLAGGNMFVRSGRSLGFLKIDEDKLHGKPGASKEPGLVEFSSRFTLPYEKARLFEGAGDYFYVVGRNEKENRDEISAWDLADSKTPARPLYATDAAIAAVAGTPERTYFAVGRGIFLLEKGAKSAKPIYVSEREDIRSLAYRPDVGLFFTTGNSAGYIGGKEPYEFLACPGVEVRLRGDALFVRLGAVGNGILRITGAKHFSEITIDPSKTAKGGKGS